MSYDEYVIESETIDTEAGEYTVRWLHDPHGEEPYDHGFGMAWDGYREYAHDSRKDVTQDEHADEVLAIIQQCGRNAVQVRISAAGMARYLRMKYGLVGIVEVDEDYNTQEPSHDLTERVYGLAWGPADAADPAEYAKGCVESYKAWANGDCFGWEVLDPHGRMVTDQWCHYGFDRERDYTLRVARTEALNDASQRIQQANLVGAGFVGLL